MSPTRPKGRARLYGIRKPTGVSIIAEFGPSMFIAFTMIILPFMTFGTMGMNYLFAVNTVRMAAQQGARAQTFKNNLTIYQNPANVFAGSRTVYSTVNTVKNVINNGTGSAGGASVTYWQCYIEQCSLNSGTISTPGNETSLAGPADPTQYTYDVQVVANCTLNPLFIGNMGFFPSVPGLNAPWTTQICQEATFETYAGLDQ